MNRKIFGVCILLIILAFIFVACSKSSKENKVTDPSGYIVSDQYSTKVEIGDLGGKLSTAVQEPDSDIFELTTSQ